MKRITVLLFSSLLFLTACGNIEGAVTDKTDSSIFVEIKTSNMEKTKKEIHFTDETIYEGSITSLEDIEVGDAVIVVPFDVPQDFLYILASEVKVE